MNPYTPLAVVVLFLVLFNDYTEACSCSKRLHPQEGFCNSDFVVLARIRKVVRKDFYTKIYKIRIRKEFKMTEKARIAFKAGKLFSPADDGMCGTSFELGKLYLLTGYINGLQANINLCNYYQPWDKVTPRQKKGFRLLYSKGCNCKISHRPSYNPNPPNKDYCQLSDYNCHSSFGICLRSPMGHCHWAKSMDLRKCLKPFKFEKPKKVFDKNVENYNKQNNQPLEFSYYRDKQSLTS